MESQVFLLSLYVRFQNKAQIPYEALFSAEHTWLHHKHVKSLANNKAEHYFCPKLQAMHQPLCVKLLLESYGNGFCA